MRYLDLLLLRYPMLACCRTDIIAAFEVLTGWGYDKDVRY